ncbi:MAG: phosphoglycerate kinase [Clostridiales bacterium]|nr:phosphoglycerate kinase [Clostridiales bacterium]
MNLLNKFTIDDLNLTDKKILLRCDFNVPMKYNKIIDNKRIKEAIPTIEKLINSNSKLVICSHLGKPNAYDINLSLKPIAEELSNLLNKKIIFIDDSNVIGPITREKIKNIKSGEIILLENTRFRSEETKNIDEFSKELSNNFDIYINDAFGSSHRKHCSTYGVAKFIKETAIGYLIQKEINFLGKALESPSRPFVAILGGAKVSDKINVIENLLDKVDILIIGGGMAYTFFKAKGYNIGKSLLEEDKVEFARNVLEKADKKNIKLLLPIDNVVVKEFKEDANFKTTKSSEIQSDDIGVDIGEKTQKLFCDALKDAKTIILNGPMGVFEFENFSRGTFSIIKTLSELDAITIIGGGDSASAVNQFGFVNKMTHISTGGGASLEFLEGKELPGISIIKNKF